MSTKTLKKELMAAVAMVLVALIALSGSTYAWFATNSRVEAKTMSVTAQSADPFLQIRYASESAVAENYKTTLVMDSSASRSSLSLVAPGTIGAVKLSDVDWYESISTDPALALTEASKTSRTAIQAASRASFFVEQHMVIKNASSIDAENLEVSVSMSGIEGGTLDDAIRVLIVTSDGAVAWFTSKGAVDITTDTDADTKLQSTAKNGKITDGKKVTLAAIIKSDTELNVDVYMFFDGRDPSSNNQVSPSAASLNCDIIFTIKGDKDNSETGSVTP